VSGLGLLNFDIRYWCRIG